MSTVATVVQARGAGKVAPWLPPPAPTSKRLTCGSCRTIGSCMRKRCPPAAGITARGPNRWRTATCPVTAGRETLPACAAGSTGRQVGARPCQRVSSMSSRCDFRSAWPMSGCTSAARLRTWPARWRREPSPMGRTSILPRANTARIPARASACLPTNWPTPSSSVAMTERPGCSPTTTFATRRNRP